MDDHAVQSLIVPLAMIVRPEGEEPIPAEDDDLLCLDLRLPDPLPEEGRMDLVAEPSGTFQFVDRSRP